MSSARIRARIAARDRAEAETRGLATRMWRKPSVHWYGRVISELGRHSPRLRGTEEYDPIGGYVKVMPDSNADGQAF